MSLPRQPDALAPGRAVTWLAGVAAALLVLPVLALLVRGGLAQLLDAAGEPAVRSALWLTGWTATVTTVLATVLGVPLALVAERGPNPLRQLAGGVGEAPLVLPPVVVGLGLLLALGREGLLGGALDAAELRLTFTSAAVVVAQLVVALPMVVVATRAGLAALDPTAELAAAAHGAGPVRRLRLATLPALRGSIALGAALAWGRAAGEFGATLTFAGSLPGRTRTLPLEVFARLQAEPGLAAAAAVLQAVLALVVLLAARRLRERSGP